MPTQIWGILNVTPDSFSDGGKYFTLEAAIQQAQHLIDAGVQVIDIGGESSRPGSQTISIEEEIQRVVPVITAIRQFSDIPISIDTYKQPVAAAAIRAGANIVNDITGLMGDPLMAPYIRDQKIPIVVMFNSTLMRPQHPQSRRFRRFGILPSYTPQQFQEFSQLSISDLAMKFFHQVFLQTQSLGIPQNQIIIDLGIGFGTTVEENWELLKNIPLFQKTFPVAMLLGVSRKRFLGELLRKHQFPDDIEHRDLLTAYITTYVAALGVQHIRVHNVENNRLPIIVGDAFSKGETNEYPND